MGAAQAPVHEDDYQEFAEFASAMEMKYKTFDAPARHVVVCSILNTLFEARSLPSSK